MGKIEFYNENELCTLIEYTVPSEPIFVKNYTEDLVHTAFGVKENVNWDDLILFLKSRCFPENRANKKQLLRLLEIEDYDPWKIVKKTQGKFSNPRLKPWDCKREIEK